MSDSKNYRTSHGFLTTWEDKWKENFICWYWVKVWAKN